MAGRLPTSSSPFSCSSPASRSPFCLSPRAIHCHAISASRPNSSPAPGNSSRLHLLPHILRRSAIIFAIGLLINAFPYYHLATWRIAGVLQRIALCYLAASVLYLWTGMRTRWAHHRRASCRLLAPHALCARPRLRRSHRKHSPARSRSQPCRLARPPSS